MHVRCILCIIYDVLCLSCILVILGPYLWICGTPLFVYFWFVSGGLID